MTYNKRIEEGYNMNAMMKISDIKIILDDWKENKCPYCHEQCTQYKLGELMCDECGLMISSNDYLSEIHNIIMGISKYKGEYKKLTEF